MDTIVIHEHFKLRGSAGKQLIYIGEDHDYSIASIIISAHAFEKKPPKSIIVQIIVEDIQ